MLVLCVCVWRVVGGDDHTHTPCIHDGLPAAFSLKGVGPMQIFSSLSILIQNSL